MKNVTLGHNLTCLMSISDPMIFFDCSVTKWPLISTHPKTSNNSFHLYQTVTFFFCCWEHFFFYIPQEDVLLALLAVVKVLLGEHVELTVQPASLVPDNKKHRHLNQKGALDEAVTPYPLSFCQFWDKRSQNLAFSATTLSEHLRKCRHCVLVWIRKTDWIILLCFIMHHVTVQTSPQCGSPSSI